MKKVIKAFKKLSKDIQTDLYSDYSDGELERTSFPYSGSIEEGVIYNTDECIYLVPISSIIEVKASASEDLEEDNNETTEIDEEEISDDIVDALSREIESINPDSDDENLADLD